jgi:hypothetical protein
MNSDELRASTAALCREMESLWTLTGYKPDASAWREVRVTTSVESGTPVLPKTGNPIRGLAGVEVRAGEPPTKDRKTLIRELVSRSILPP